MLALASVLSLLRPPKAVVRYAITAAELLTRSAGAFACEAALGWLEPPELSDEVVQAAQATAASLGAKSAQRGAAVGAVPGAKPEKAAEAGQGRRSEQKRAANVKGDDMEIDGRNGGRSRRRHDDADQEPLHEDNQDQASDQEAEPLVEYDDEQRQDGMQYSEDYAASEQEHPDYAMEGNEDQEQDQQYNEGDDEQQYFEDDDHQDQAELPTEQQQEGDNLQDSEQQLPTPTEDDNVEDVAKPRRGSQDDGSQQGARRGQPDDDADEWAVPESGDCTMARDAVCANHVKLVNVMSLTTVRCTDTYMAACKLLTYNSASMPRPG